MWMRRCFGVLAAAVVAGAATQASAVLVDTFDPATAGATATQVGTAPGPVVTAGGPTGNFLRLVNDTINGQNNHYAYTRSDVGAFTKVQGTFDARISSAGAPADGFSYVLLPTAAHGISGAGFTGFTAEEPNIANTFAAGFDLHPAPGTNDVSVHFNGVEHRNITVPTGTLDLDNGTFNRYTVTLQHVTGGAYASIQITNDVHGVASPTITPLSHFIPGLTPYENRVQFSGRTGGLDMNVDLDNINVAYSNPLLSRATIQNFEGGDQTPMHFLQSSTGPGPIVYSGGPAGSFVRLVNDGITSQNNSVSLAATDGGLTQTSRIRASFDFRVIDGPAAGRADGFSFLLLPTDTYGNHGPGPGGFVAEEPNLAGVIAVGFDVFPGVNDVSLHFGSEVVNVPVSTGLINLSAGVFHRAELVVSDDGATVSATLILTPDILGAPGAPVVAFSNVVIPGLADLYTFRGQFTARTGGETMSVDIDNIVISTVPEPASALMGLIGLAALAVRRRRAA
jgi:MYXO-CTERM domain-containing protein